MIALIGGLFRRLWSPTATTAVAALLVILNPVMATSANGSRRNSTMVCGARSPGGMEMEVEGRLLTTLYHEASVTALVVDTSAQDVSVRCRAPAGHGSLWMNDEDGKPLSETEHTESAQDGEVIWARFWRANYSAIWHREKMVECGRGQEQVCRVRLIQANTVVQPGANCTRDNGHLLWCNISEWMDERDKQKSGGLCDSGKFRHAASFRYSFYNAELEEWTSCGEFDEKRTVAKQDKDVAFLQCNISGVTQSVETLILRMEKSHISQASAGLSFMNKVDCTESSYLTIPGDVLESADSGVTTATAATIAVFATAFILILCACLLRQLKRRRRKSSQSGTVMAFTNSEADLAYVKSERPLIQAEISRSSARQPESGNDESHSCEDVNSYLPMTVQDAESKEKLVESLLSGHLERVNPELPLSHQTRVLNYDKRFEIPPANFKIDCIIGGGQYGTVFRGTAWGICGQEPTKVMQVAIKQTRDVLDHTQIATIIDELKILSNLNMHLNLVNLLGACTSQLYTEERQIYLLLEYCPFGDLKKFLFHRRKEFEACLNNHAGHLESIFNGRLLMSWAYSIAKGMEYLASKSVMHGDLAARNILVGENYTAKITDFGLSKMMYYNQDYKKTERRFIPWAWMAVEYLQTGEFNMMSDVWSFGVTLWEIFSLGDKPYGLEPYEDMKVKILSGHRLPPPGPLDLIEQGERLYQNVMCSCWDAAPSQRPSFSRLVSLLADQLGEQGVREYADHLAMYDTSRDSGLGTEPPSSKSDPAPRGYIRVESVCKQTSDCTDIDHTADEEENVQARTEGYSRASVVVPGPTAGYIGLADVK